MRVMDICDEHVIHIAYYENFAVARNVALPCSYIRRLNGEWLHGLGALTVGLYSKMSLAETGVRAYKHAVGLYAQ